MLSYFTVFEQALARTAFGKSSVIPWPEIAYCGAFYQRILKLRSGHPAIRARTLCQALGHNQPDEAIQDTLLSNYENIKLQHLSRNSGKARHAWRLEHVLLSYWWRNTYTITSRYALLLIYLRCFLHSHYYLWVEFVWTKLIIYIFFRGDN